MKTVLIAALVLAAAPLSLGVAQDTARTARKVEKLVTPRRDSVRMLPRDSVRFRVGFDSVRWVNRDSVGWAFNRDSVRFVVPDSVLWLVAASRDTARTPWLPDTLQRSPSFELGKPAVPTLQAQNGNSAFAEYLYPPEYVMQHQARLKLTEQQRDAIVAEINKLQATAVQAQWRVGDESEKLAELLRRETVSETEALAQAERLIAQETSVKRAQLSMLIRIRNVLTPEQREFLYFRRKAPRE